MFLFLLFCTAYENSNSADCLGIAKEVELFVWTWHWKMCLSSLSCVGFCHFSLFLSVAFVSVSFWTYCKQIICWESIVNTKPQVFSVRFKLILQRSFCRSKLSGIITITKNRITPKKFQLLRISEFSVSLLHQFY